MKKTSRNNILAKILKRNITWPQKIVVALTALFILAVIVSAGDVIVENGKINLEGNLIVEAPNSIGIGVAIPAQKLDVAGQIHATGDICTDAAGGKCLSDQGLGGGGGSLWTPAGNNIFYDSGKVGIGAQIPSRALTVRTDEETIADFRSNDGTGEIVVGDSTGIAAINVFNGGDIRIKAGTNDMTSPDLYIKTDGKVGIGVNPPTQKLDVAGQIHATGDICTDKNGGKCLSTDGSSLWTPAGNDIFYDKGNVGIGTANPQGWKTWIEYVDTATPGLKIHSTGTAGTALAVDIDGSPRAFTVRGNGLVGIGTPAPGAPLEVVGNIKADTNAHDNCAWTTDWKWNYICPQGKYLAGLEVVAGSFKAYCCSI